MRNFRKKIRVGDLLLQYGIISEEQLKEALQYQKSTGKKIGEVLIELGFASKDNINEVLEFQLGIPYVDLLEYDVDTNAIAAINESLAKRHKLLPIKITDTQIYVAMEDPLNIFAIDDIRIYSGKEVIPMLADEIQLNRSIDIYYGKQQSANTVERYKKEHQQEEDVGIVEDESDNSIKNAPIVKLVNMFLEQGVHNRASDIHIEPYESKVRVRYRIDGILKELFEYEKSILPAILARIKIISGLDISEKRKPQDGRISANVDGKDFDIRVSILPTTHGEKVVMRLNSQEGFSIGKAHLGFFPDDLQKFDDMLSNPHGIILVTGPTGSGKSTTLYTALNEINNENINIVTVEDPVESKIEGINQVQVNEKVGLTFATALRSILRQDPDVIMLGEIRDKETAEIAVKASITGHLVVSTLHTNDAPSSVVRLIDMGIEPFLISASVVGVIAQRLVRKLCPKCRKLKQANDKEKVILGLSEHENAEIYEAVGCHVCNNTGYSKRIGIYEIMPIDQEIRSGINRGLNSYDIRKIAINNGMKTLKNNAARLVINGTTTIDELLKIAYGGH